MANFLSFTKIKIPVIQRDYVQGRNDEEAREVRQRFLDDLFEYLSENKNFHLDFVFGTYEEDAFIPIDGQQRLTTLFLLYTYFLKRENKTFNVELTYETRTSSKEFIELLNKISFKFDQDKEISKQIKQNKYFIPYWEFDPTVESMLNMLDEIHKKANQLYLKGVSNIHERLNKITFTVFDLKDLGESQAEELYRKMNSRGKILTKLENFKAILEQIAYKENSNLYKEIAQKFEGEWSDFFWEYRDNENLIDDSFMNLIYFITEMIIYERGETQKVDYIGFNRLKKIYSEKHNFDFLIKVLNNLTKIKENSVYVKNNLKFFFDKERHVDLLEGVLKKYSSLSVAYKILSHFLILSTFTYSQKSYVVDLLRIIRNYLNQRRTLKKGRISYDLTIGYEDVFPIIKRYKTLLENDRSPYHELLNLNGADISEQKVAKILISDNAIKQILFDLEDNEYIKGDLRLLLSLNLNLDDSQKVKFFSKVIPILFENIPTEVLTAAILTYGNYSLEIGAMLNNGRKMFFGQKRYWEIFLTYNPKIVGKKYILEKFFDDIAKKQEINVDILEEIIRNKFKEKEYDWCYYFLRYPIILSDGITVNFATLKNVFGWFDDKALIEKLESEKRITNNRQNVYILAVLRKLIDEYDFISLASFIANDNLTYYHDDYLHIEADSGVLIVIIGNKSKEFELFGDYDGVEAAVNFIKENLDILIQEEDLEI